MTSCSKELRPEPTPKHPLQITTRALKEPDFKFELLPLHSPLLRQSLLVSFPPLIDMLKFSGYPCLIRGQPCEWVFRQTGPRLSKRKILLRLKPVPRRRAFRGTSSVQRFDDSLNSAIHTTYRISLRSSSMPEPRDPLLKVLIRCL